ncbi:hypothetical protein PMKS-002883 [Pichia membranifaciens]|uniref:Uncharacterized protein n=1 Tax=Pichia membranifaciens TaxID=4926 RepID=A0A1Q2YJ31_9ASCO|nr:hypothetical protein PMKS-002883 [Pichia membranifaciens]
MVVVIQENYILDTDPVFISKRADQSTTSSSENNAVSKSSSSSSSQTSGVDALLDSYGCVIYNADGTNSTGANSLNSAEIGGIAGGLSGFVFILLLVGIYFLYKKYKNHLLVDYELGIGEEMKELTGFNDYDDDFDEGTGGGYGDGVRNNMRNARSSQFLHPSNAEKRMSQTSLSTMTNSVLTKASNVLNIVYIPGVTNSRPARPIVGGSRRNTRRPVDSTYSRGMSVYSKETYFSDLENASFHGGNVATRGGNPMLVEINQDDYNYDDEDKGLREEDEDVNYPININLQLPPLPARRQMDDDIVEEEDEAEDEMEGREHNNSIKNGYESDIDDSHERKRAGIGRGKKFHLIGEGEEFAEDEEDAIQLDIGLSDSNDHIGDNNNSNRTVPNRYAALVEKKDQLNHAQLGPFASSKETEEAADLHNESYSDSSSDSDEENIEMLLHQNGQSSNSNTNSNLFNSNTSNPFLSPLD